MLTQNIIISGMVCKYCKQSIEKTLLNIQGVRKASADVLSGTVKVEGDKINLPKIKEDIENIGYTVVGTI